MLPPAQDPTAHYRRDLERLGYRMLGSWADAEDIAQESLLRWHKLTPEQQAEIREPLAWLRTAASRISLDRLKSAQHQRETYVGPWLPEPLLTDEHSPADQASIEDSITYALLHAMERLSPTERAAFILHDVFDYSFPQIADILKKEEANCRQLASRARRALRAEKAKRPVEPESHQQLLTAFLAAAEARDAQTLESLLAQDATLYSDGGKLAKAARRPLHSSEIITRLFLGLSRKAKKTGLRYEVQLKQINGQPTALIYNGNQLETVLFITIQNQKIATIYQQRNPEKLRHLLKQLG
ncbi:RNA polymerase sigma factor SigJ [Pelagicoccus mobilis]|uniref:RNA polymerase sigma factor SigJ n=1 Tax=Pelagicoccus mobilis TaxID=415221 RepID=A0A934VPJ2_9BACT|nr:RNA polymerase sigma factor SigJ [Pelagicoccus mobilis]MBK1875584.1 RNA polymerase sigma factor SigJ [Pelagicoccus mobilis]